MTDPIYPSFAAFMEAVVLPRMIEHPSHVQLDGKTAGGNRDVAGRFRFDGNVWKAHEDCRYEPLLLAYWAMRFHPDRPALVRADTNRSGVRLDLVPELAALHGETHRYLYLYLDSQ